MMTFQPAPPGRGSEVNYEYGDNTLADDGVAEGISPRNVARVSFKRGCTGVLAQV